MDYHSGIEDGASVSPSTDEVFEQLEREGADRAVVVFGGGNDEGGTESSRLYSEGGVERELQEYVWGYETDEKGETVYGEDEGSGGRTFGRPETRPLTAEEEAEMVFAQALPAPVYDECGSFAGDFYVHGTVVWDVKERRVCVEGSQYVRGEF
jgi:hypothetical protein